ncbi:MAG: Ser-Thr-rich GPI-anchored membrane family protein [Bryobacteraceae bacterium]
MGVAGDRNINAGSIARIVWRVAGETGENVSDDIILNHRAGANVIQTLIADLKTLPLELGAGSPSHTGWNGLVDGFRIDPHEFPDARTFWIKSIALRALESANASYVIRWNFTNQDTSAGPVMSLYWDSDASGFDGTQIASGIASSAGTYTWNTSTLPNGTYYIYTVVSLNGRTVNQNYARLPIVVSHGAAVPTASLTLSRPQLRFGATQNGATVTAPQDVLVNVKGSGAVAWTAVSDQPYVQVTPATGSGSAKFTVSVNSAALTGAPVLNATITVTGAGFQNSPQYVQVIINSMTSTSPPKGFVDTPANGLTA